MSRGRRPGFSLVEIVIAVAILALATLTFIQILRSSGSRLVMTGHTFAANHAAMKAIADLQEDARLTGSLLELIDEIPEMSTADRLVDGQSVYFRYLRDRATPFGLLEPARDGGIIRDEAFLYSQLEPMTLLVKAERVRPPSDPVPERHVARVTVRLDWDERNGPARDYEVESMLTSPVGPRQFDEVKLFDEADLPGLARGFLFPDQSEPSFDKICTAAKADSALLLDCGRVSLSMELLRKSLASASAEIAALATRRQALLAAPTPELPAIQLRLARRYEAAAGLIYHVLHSLAPTLERIKTSLAPAKFGWTDYHRMVSGFHRYSYYLGQLPDWVARAGQEYEWMLADGLWNVRSRRQEEFGRLKALEAFRLAQALDPSRKAAFTAFLQRQETRLTGRNPAWDRLLLREARLAGDPARLRQVYGNLDGICKTVEDEFRPMAAMADLISEKRYPN